MRDFMEPRFGADFSGVRIHSGSQAAQLNRAVSEAVTIPVIASSGTVSFSGMPPNERPTSKPASLTVRSQNWCWSTAAGR